MAKTFKSEGIVLRSLKYSETSIILDIYSKGIGLHSYIVSGVRKAKSKSANIYNPINVINFVAYNSENKLSRIKEGQFAYRYQKTPFDVMRSTISMYMIDLARHAIKEKEANESLYHFIKTSLIEVDSRDGAFTLIPIQFSIQLSSYLGFGITDNHSDINTHFDLDTGQFVPMGDSQKYGLDEQKSLILSLLLKGQNPSINKEIRNQLLDDLLTYYKLHIEGFSDLKSLQILRTILS